MKKYKYGSLFIFLVFNVVLFNTTIYANSSWQWISDTRPFDILPWVAIGTIIIETAALNWGANVHRLYKVFGITLLANIVSFVLPYFLRWTDDITHMKYHLFSQMIQFDHIYTISAGYFFLTILAEGPIVFCLLRKDTGKCGEKRLLFTILLSNLVTTIMVAIVERYFCHGTW